MRQAVGRLEDGSAASPGEACRNRAHRPPFTRKCLASVALGLTARALAEQAGVSHDTIVRQEGGQELKASTVRKVRETFEAAGIEFTNGTEPGLKIKSPDGVPLIAPARTASASDRAGNGGEPWAQVEKENVMIENGTAYASALAIRHLLRLLERKKVLAFSETKQMLDGILEEIRDVSGRGAISPKASADASNTIGMMYLRRSRPLTI